MKATIHVHRPTRCNVEEIRSQAYI